MQRGVERHHRALREAPEDHLLARRGERRLESREQRRDLRAHGRKRGWNVLGPVDPLAARPTLEQRQIERPPGATVAVVQWEWCFRKGIPYTRRQAEHRRQ